MTKILILFFSFFTSLIRICYPQCLFNTKISLLCGYCAFNYFDSKADLHYHNNTSNPLYISDCITKFPHVTERRRILVSNTKDYDIRGFISDFDQIYYDLIESFINETIVALPYYNSFLTIFLSKGVHIINTTSKLLFRRLNSTIVIKPLYCDEYPILEICTDINEKPTILLKSLIFSFIITAKLHIKNIDFNAIYAYSDANANCDINSLVNINNSCSININESYYISDNYFYGFFNLEAMYDDPEFLLPELNLTNVKFDNFYIYRSFQTSFLSLIVIDYFGGNIYIKNMTIDHSFFDNSFILYNESFCLNKAYYNFNGFTDYLLFYSQNTRKKFNLEIENLNIENYNLFGYEKKFLQKTNIAGFILMNDFPGDIYFQNISFLNISTRNYRYLFYFLKINSSNFIDLTVSDMNQMKLFYFQKSNIIIRNFLITNTTWLNYPFYCLDNTILSLKQFKLMNSSSVLSSNVFLYGLNLQIVLDSNEYNSLISLSFLFINSFVILINCTFSNIILSSLPFIFQNTPLISIDTTWLKITKFDDLLYFLDGSNAQIINNTFIQLDGNSFISGNLLLNVLIKRCTFKNLTNFSFLLNKYTIFQIIIIENSTFNQITFTGALIYSTNTDLSLISCEFNNISFISQKSTALIYIQIGHELVQDSNFFNILFYAGGIAVIRFKVSTSIVKNSNFKNCGFLYPIQISDLISIEYVNMLYFWSCFEVLIQNSSFVNEGAINLFSGFVYCNLNAVKFSLIGNIFRYTNKKSDIYYTGIILSASPIVIFIDNKFHGFECPEYSSFLYNHGAVSLQGENTYSAMKNNKSAYLINNSFYDCKCQYGGSLGIINYEYVYANQLFFYNSSSNIGGSMLLISSTFVSFERILCEFTTANQAHTIKLRYIENSYFDKFVILNALGQRNGGFQVRDVKLLQINLMKIFNVSTLDSGAVFNIQLGKSIISNSFFQKCKTNLNGAVIYLTKAGNLSLFNVTVYNCSAQRGGAIYIDHSIKVVIYGCLFDKTYSKYQGSSIVINLIQSFALSSTKFYNCQSKTNGILYFKNIENDALYNITDLYCYGNIAQEGSCIFSETRGNMYIANYQIQNNSNNCLFFISSFKIIIILFNGSIYDSISKENIIYVNGVFLSIIKLFLDSNSIYDALLFFEKLQLSKIEMITFRNNIKNNLTNSPTPAIYSLSSDLEIINLEFFQNTEKKTSWTFLIYSLKSKLKISNTKIFNQSHNDDALILINYGTFFLNTSTFQECQGPVLKSNDANISIDFTSFDNNTQAQNVYINDISISGFFTQDIGVTIKNSYFSTRNGLSSIITHIKTISYINCTFKGNLDFKNQALMINEAYSICITNSSFISYANLDGKGGAIRIAFGIITTAILEISNSSYISNKACIGGALFFEGLYNLTLRYSNFISNIALKSNSSVCGLAGVGLFHCSPYLACFFVLEGNFFENNYAEALAPTIFSRSYLKETNSVFVNNTDGLNFTNKLTTFPLYITLLTNQNEIHFSSGQSFSLVFLLKDSFNQSFFTFSNTTGLLLKVQNSADLTLTSPISLPTNKGVFNFSELSIVKNPETLFLLKIQLSIYDDIALKHIQFAETFHFFSEPCKIGEIFTEFKCKMCPTSSYSIKNPMKNQNNNINCVKCEKNAYCPGGSYLIPEEGYWRFSSNSSKIVKCISRLACIGPPDIAFSSELFINYDQYSIEEELVNGGCFEGQQNNLCFKCKEGYGKPSTYSLCSLCTEIRTFTYFKIAFNFSIVLIYSLMSIRALINSQKRAEYAEVIGIVVKICISHLQKMSIMTFLSLNGKIPKDMESFVGFLNTASLLNEDNFSNECLLRNFFDDSQNFYLYKVTFSLIVPLIESIICLIFLIIINGFLSLRKHKGIITRKRIYMIFLIGGFVFYPFVTKCSLSLINCIALDNTSKTFLYLSPNILCWEGIHKTFFFFIALFGIFFMGLLFPWFLVFLIHRNIRKTFKKNKVGKIQNFSRKMSIEFFDNINTGSQKETEGKNNDQIEKKGIFYFFYRDYKNQFYYWECIIFMQKFFLSLLPNLMEIVEEGLDIIFFGILFIYLFLILRNKPFKIRKLNNLEVLSIFACVFSRLLFAFLNAYNNNIEIVTFCSISLILTNTCFFIVAFYSIYKYVKWRDLIRSFFICKKFMRKKRCDNIPSTILNLSKTSSLSNGESLSKIGFIEKKVLKSKFLNNHLVK